MSIKLSDLSPKYQQQAAQKFFKAQAKSKHRQNRTREPQDRVEGKRKYRNTPDERIAADGTRIRFASKAEASHFDDLMAQQKAGLIRGLKLQPEFTLQEAFTTIEGEHIRAIRYRADFSYDEQHEIDIGDGVKEFVWEPVVEDVKGKKTDVYNIKRKMMQEKFGITVVEV